MSERTFHPHAKGIPAMNRDKIRYAVIGCGEHAIRGHVVPGNEVPSLTCVGAYDPDDAKMAEVRDARAEGTSFSRYRSESGLLGDRGIDAVVIASPDRFHAPSLAAAVAAGKHVLCDKPLAQTVDDLRLLRRTLDEAEERGLVVTSCHPRRFDPPYLWLKLWIDGTTTFGDVQNIELDFSYHAPSKVGLHSGLLADHFNHEFDLLHFLCGHAPAVIHKLVDGDTRYMAVGMREDGVGFTFHGTRKLDAKHYREFARLRFERGDVELDCSSGSAVVHAHETGGKDVVLPGKTDYAKRFRDIMANFAGAIAGETENYLTRRDLVANAESCVYLTDCPQYGYRPL
jgi:predicted dehydrogenase